MKTYLCWITLAAAIFLTGCQVEVASLDPIGEAPEEQSNDSEEDSSDDSGNDDNGSQDDDSADDSGNDDNGSQDDDSSDDSGNSGDSQSQSVTLYWSAPVERVNGDVMVDADVGGYEIRYRLTEEESYTSILVDAVSDQYSIDDLENADDYVFEVAVFDTDGIYSDFVTAVAN